MTYENCLNKKIRIQVHLIKVNFQLLKTFQQIRSKTKDNLETYNINVYNTLKKVLYIKN